MVGVVSKEQWEDVLGTGIRESHEGAHPRLKSRRHRYAHLWHLCRRGDSPRAPKRVYETLVDARIEQAALQVVAGPHAARVGNDELEARTTSTPAVALRSLMKGLGLSYRRICATRFSYDARTRLLLMCARKGASSEKETG